MYYDSLKHRICLRCNRSIQPIRLLKIDPKTKKKWYIIQCPKCQFNFEIEEYSPHV